MVSKNEEIAKKIESSIKQQKPVEWISALSVEEPNIDKQHHNLLNQLNKLLELTKKGEEIKTIRSCIHFFDTYVKEHFAYEEN